MADGSTSERLEQDLQDAQERGRWLSDEEQRCLDDQRQQQDLVLEQQQSRRQRLIVLTGLCILLPPFWPLAFVLGCYLLFPETVARIGLVAGVVLIGSVLATIALLVIVTNALLNLLG